MSAPAFPIIQLQLHLGFCASFFFLANPSFPKPGLAFLFFSGVQLVVNSVFPLVCLDSDLMDGVLHSLPCCAEVFVNKGRILHHDLSPVCFRLVSVADPVGGFLLFKTF